MRIVFMGTPGFALPSLEILIKEGHEIPAVATQPDKLKGRGRKLAAPPVKEYAVKQGLSVMQPYKVRTDKFFDELKNLHPELIVTCAYGKILPPSILKLPDRGCINVHASLLPRLRGAAPINHAIINGEEKTGITTMFMDDGIDTGDMILQREVQITENMTAGELHDVLAGMGADVLKETIWKIMDDTAQRIPQDDDMATYAPMLDRDIGRIRWDMPSKMVHNLVRGLNPSPGAYTFRGGRRMKIWKTSLEHTNPAAGQPGTIISSGSDGLLVSCGTGCVRILEIQMENSRRMDIRECWHNISEGEMLG